jgi:hypothetical protein
MKKMYCIAAMASLVLAGCSNNEYSGYASDPNMLYVVAGVGKPATRSLVTGTAFSAGQIVGVFVTGTGYTPALSKYTLSGTTTWTPDAPIYLTGQTATVYGYFPNTATNSGTLNASTTITTTLFSAPTSGTSTETSFTGAGQADYLWATPTTASNLTAGTTNLATLAFNHALSRISFIIKKDANYPTAAGSGNITSIKLTAGSAILPTLGTAKVADGTFTATTASNATNLQLTPASTTYINAAGVTTETACVLLAPTTTALTGIGLQMTIDGKTMTATGFPAAPTWVKGTSYAYTVTVSPTSLVVNTVTITDWTAGTAVTSITAQ